MAVVIAYVNAGCVSVVISQTQIRHGESWHPAKSRLSWFLWLSIVPSRRPPTASMYKYSPKDVICKHRFFSAPYTFGRQRERSRSNLKCCADLLQSNDWRQH